MDFLHTFTLPKVVGEPSLCLKINTILELNTQTNMKCKMIILSLILYDKDLDVRLSFVCETLESLTFLIS